MSWRSILISSPSKLYLKQNQLVIKQEEAYSVPLEDIAIILIEEAKVQITVPLLSALAQYGITLLTCDNFFLPCGQWLPLNGYHRGLKIYKLQLEISLPIKKCIWQKIIQSKIRNQADVLAQIGDNLSANRLFIMAQEVKSNDKTNLEAQAAVFYFKKLFNNSFKRTINNAINAHLNYGYSILRSTIARALILSGFQPILGIYHDNELNPFNLADDILEPFRPLVDRYVWMLIQNNKLSLMLSPSSKQSLIQLLHHQILLQQKNISVLTAIEQTVKSLRNALEYKNSNYLKMPKLLPIKEYDYE